MRRGLTLLAAVLVMAFELGTAAAAPRLTWQHGAHIRGIFDVIGPRHDGSLVVAARGGLDLVTPGGKVTRFAPTYVPSAGEAYIAISPGSRDVARHCVFARDAIAALALKHQGPGVILISPAGRVSRLAVVGGVTNLFGITFDATGQFGHRILVVGRVPGGNTRISAIDCLGRVATVSTVKVPLEGGIVVAPPTFGPFAGDLIAPDELNGNLYAVSPAGRVRTVVASGLPFGADVGVESLGFVPAEGPGGAYLSDRATPGGAHPGNDRILVLSGAALTSAGVLPGDLLAGTEGGATVIRVTCAAACSVGSVVSVPTSAHAEGSLSLVPSRVSPHRDVGTVSSHPGT